MNNINKIFILLLLFSAMVTGINAQTPPVNGNVVEGDPITNGLRVPVLTEAQIEDIDVSTRNASRGLLIFNLDRNCTQFWNGEKWVSLCTDVGSDDAPVWFHCPSSVIPTLTTDPAGNYAGGFFNFNIYEWYAQNMGLTLTGASAHSLTPAEVTAGKAAAIPVYAAADLIYLVTYYDNTVFSEVSISATGILKYKVLPGAVPSAKTYMNIIFKAK